MRVDATAVEEAIRAVLDEMGLASDPVSVEFPSGHQAGGGPLLGEDRDAPQVSGIAVFIAKPEAGEDLDRVYLMEPGPDGKVEVADVDQNLRTVRLGSVADGAWGRLADRLGTTQDRLLAYED